MSYIIEACLSYDLAVFTKSRKWSLGFYAKPLSYISQVKFLSNSPGKFCFFEFPRASHHRGTEDSAKICLQLTTNRAKLTIEVGYHRLRTVKSIILVKTFYSPFTVWIENR